MHLSLIRLSVLLLVCVFVDLHCLYDFLLHQDRRELNVPKLLASNVFLNATTQALNVVRVGAMARTKIESTPKQAMMGSCMTTPTEFVLDITGPILPASVVRLLALFNRTQEGDFQAVFSSDFPGMNLNCVDSVLVSGREARRERRNAHGGVVGMVIDCV